MAKIYRSAGSIILWLRQECDDSNLAMGLITTLYMRCNVVYAKYRDNPEKVVVSEFKKARASGNEDTIIAFMQPWRALVALARRRY